MVITLSNKDISSAIRDLKEAILDWRCGVVFLEDLPSEDGKLSWDWQDPDNYRLNGKVGLLPFDEALEAIIEEQPEIIALVEIKEELEHMPRFYHFEGDICWNRLAAYGGRSRTFHDARGEYRYMLQRHEIKKVTIHLA